MNASLKVLRLTLFILLAFANLSPARILGWRFLDGMLEEVNIPRAFLSSEPITPLHRAMIGSNEFCIHQESGSVVVGKCNAEAGEILWQTPDSWQVRESFFADLDRDGEQELVLLVWRPFAPWPVDRFMPHGGRINNFQDEAGNSCHLILIRLTGKVSEEIWAGSALADPLHSLLPVDLDGDGYQELAAIEYSYDRTNSAGSIVVWQWNGFGFSLEDRAPGTFKSMHAFNVDSSVILITQQQ